MFGVMEDSGLNNGRGFSVEDPTASSSVRRDAKVHAFISSVSQHIYFVAFMMTIIIINAVFIILEGEVTHPGTCRIIEKVCIFLYGLELGLKIYVEPCKFWRCGWNVLSAVLLLLFVVEVIVEEATSYIYFENLSPLRGLQILKIINYFPSIQALVVTLAKAMKRAAFIAGIIFYMMFVFGVAGVLYFGTRNSGDAEHWGNLYVALLSMSCLVTVDSWVIVSDEMDKLGVPHSRLFATVFIIIVHFLFFNMFVGIVVIEAGHRTQDQKSHQKSAQKMKKKRGKSFDQLIGCQVSTMKTWSTANVKTDDKFQRLMQQLKLSLNKLEYFLTKEMSSSLTFIRTYESTLKHQEDTVEKMQHSYEESLEVLSELLKLHQKERRHKKSWLHYTHEESLEVLSELLKLHREEQRSQKQLQLRSNKHFHC